MEMERFTKLSEALVGRDDVQLLSFNVDEDLTSFRSFMAGKSFPYPVMAAYHYAKQFMEFVSVPRIWIVGPKGEWTWEKSGSDLKAPHTIDDILKRIPPTPTTP